MRAVRVQKARFRLITAVRIGAMAFAVVASGAAIAADDDDEYKAPGWTDKITDSVKDAIGAGRQKIGLDKAPGPAPSEAPSGCPTIALLPGTEAQRIMAPGATDNQGLKYQYSILNVGRECSISGNSVTIKVGADGRVLLGPAGAPGHFDVPIRVAVFSEAQQKAVESRLFRVPVSVPAGQSAAPFNFVSGGVTVAIPPGRSGDYSIKVGIDPGGKGGGDAPKATKHARRHKPAATQSASQ